MTVSAPSSGLLSRLDILLWKSGMDCCIATYTDNNNKKKKKGGGSAVKDQRGVLYYLVCQPILREVWPFVSVRDGKKKRQDKWME